MFILLLAMCFGATSLLAQPSAGSIVTHSLPAFGPSIFDSAGNAYTTGTYAVGNSEPVTPGAAQTQPGGGTCTINAFPVGPIPVPCPDAK
jgi:hypothetical protein